MQALNIFYNIHSSLFSIQAYSFIPNKLQNDCRLKVLIYNTLKTTIPIKQLTLREIYRLLLKLMV